MFCVIVFTRFISFFQSCVLTIGKRTRIREYCMHDTNFINDSCFSIQHIRFRVHNLPNWHVLRSRKNCSRIWVWIWINISSVNIVFCCVTNINTPNYPHSMQFSFKYKTIWLYERLMQRLQMFFFFFFLNLYIIVACAYKSMSIHSTSTFCETYF